MDPYFPHHSSYKFPSPLLSSAKDPNYLPRLMSPCQNSPTIADTCNNRPTKRCSPGDDACRRLLTKADTDENQEEEDMSPVKKMRRVSIDYCPIVSNVISFCLSTGLISAPFLAIM